MNRFLFVIIALLLCRVAVAQSGFSSFGGDVSNMSGSVSFTLGQPADLGYRDTAITVNLRTASLHEGLQQPYLSIEQLSVDEPVLSVGIEVFPNPNMGHFRIRTDSAEELRFELFNAAGQRIRMGSFVGEVGVEMSEYAAGGYVLRVSMADGSQAHCYRVVKGH